VVFRAHTVLTEYIAWARLEGFAYPFEIVTSDRSIDTPAMGVVRMNRAYVQIMRYVTKGDTC
jgi:hypothetical protein